MRVYFLSLLLGAFSFMSDQAEAQPSLDPENLLHIELDWGMVIIGMRPDLAPNTVDRIKALARDKFYDGLTFHRVIPGFMAQGGDPDGTGAGGSGQNLDAEFNTAPHLRGTVSMARTDDPNSADSQFFICFDRAAHLDNQYTVWGRVVSGMEHVDRIEIGTVMRSVRVGADLAEG